jgi:hypothetical protein
MPVHDPNVPTPLMATPKPAKWSQTFWADLAERVGATAIGALLAVFAGSQAGAIPNDPAAWWAVVGVPVVVSLLKGLLANLQDPSSGPSLLPSPPAPEIDEAGYGYWPMLLLAALAVAVFILALRG